MASYEVRLFYIVSGLDRLVSETQVGNSNASGLFGIVLEVSLYFLVRVVAYDFNAVLVGSDSSVTAQTPELALNCSCRNCIRIF